MLKEIPVSINDLLLDPNNPRFIVDLREMRNIPDEKIEEKQESILNRYDHHRSRADKELDVTNIKDLYDSMRDIGFVEIDRVVVRRLVGVNKHLVIEGNRRISTVKKLLNHLKDGTITNPSERRKLESLMSSFTTINCMLLDTTGLSQEQIEHRIAVILGLRHHGSLLEWEPLPRAYNIFIEYMSEEPLSGDFEFDNRKTRSVANRLSIPRRDVKKALQTYIAYLQLSDRFSDVKDRYFSLIEAGTTNKFLLGSHFNINKITFKLDEESLTKMDEICQFTIRDSLPEGKKKIIADPKKFKLLGTLIDKRQRAAHEATKAYANDLIRRVEDEDDIEMTLDEAVDALTAFENRQQWTIAISDLLNKQEVELRIEDYTGTGNDRGNKDELKQTLVPLRKIMDI